MLRYFYLISLFICISGILAYGFKGAHELNRNSHRFNRRNGRVKKSIVGVRKNLGPRYQYNSPVQQFNVASFIQGSEEALDDEEPYGFGVKKGRSASNEDYEIETSNGFNEKKTKKNQDYPNIGAENPHEFNVNSPLYKDAVNPRSLNVNGLLSDGINRGKFGRQRIRNANKDFTVSDTSINHNPKKKCSLRNMKFPFFSHNKSQTLKPKKNKKRKLFCLNCPSNSKKASGEGSKRLDAPNMPLKVKRAHKILNIYKRTGAHNEVNDKEKKNTGKIIHNSRQFYEHLDKMLHNSKQLYGGDAQDLKNRDKREEGDRDRQLKELEEVQKKIDAVDIRVPNFEKNPSEPLQDINLP